MGLTVNQGADPTPALRVLRKAAGHTQESLARAAACSLSLIKLLEGGYRPASSTVLPRIASVLGCAVEDLQLVVPEAPEFPIDGQALTLPFNSEAPAGNQGSATSA